MFDYFRTIQAMPMKFAVKIVRLKVYNYDYCQSDDLDLHSRSQKRLKLLLVFKLQYLCQYFSYTFNNLAHRYLYAWHIHIHIYIYIYIYTFMLVLLTLTLTLKSFARLVPLVPFLSLSLTVAQI